MEGGGEKKFAEILYWSTATYFPPEHICPFRALSYAEAESMR